MQKQNTLKTGLNSSNSIDTEKCIVRQQCNPQYFVY